MNSVARLPDLALLGVSHETNTFSRVPATYDRFEIYRGDEIAAQFGESHSTNAGFLEAAGRFEFDIVPLVYAVTGPIGTITEDAFDRIVDEMLGLLRDGGPWDGVLLSQHGAAVSEEYPDADGEVAARVRALVGPDVPVGMMLDLHTNLSQKMIENTTATVLYRTGGTVPWYDPADQPNVGNRIHRRRRGPSRPGRRRPGRPSLCLSCGGAAGRLRTRLSRRPGVQTREPKSRASPR